MKLTCYTATKRMNALSRPDVDGGYGSYIEYSSLYLKDAEDLNHPVFVLNTYDSSVPYNYCKLTGGVDRARYYWIDSVKCVRSSVWELHCSIDALATWADVIKSQAAFIERSYTYYDPYIIDSALPSSNNFNVRKITEWQNGDLALNFSQGTIFFAVRSTDLDRSSGLGITVLAMNKDCADAFSSWNNATNVWDTINDTMNSVADCLLSAWWLPVKYSSVSGTNKNSIVIANNTFNPSNMGVTGAQMKVLSGTSAAIESTGIITLNCTKNNDFRDTPQFRTYSAYFPCAGYTELNSVAICKSIQRASGGQIDAELSVVIDLIGRTITYLLCDYNSDIVLASVSGSIGLEIPMSHFKANLAGVIGGSAAAVGALGATIMTGGITAPLAVAAVGGGVSAIGSAMGGTTSIIGGLGGSSYLLTPYMSIYETANDLPISPTLAASNIGRPCFSPHTLSGCEYYTKTQGFSVKGAMTLEEKKQINDYMNTGVFMTE